MPLFGSFELVADRRSEMLQRPWPVPLPGAALIAVGSVLLVAASGVLVAGVRPDWQHHAKAYGPWLRVSRKR